MRLALMLWCLVFGLSAGAVSAEAQETWLETDCCACSFGGSPGQQICDPNVPPAWCPTWGFCGSEPFFGVLFHADCDAIPGCSAAQCANGLDNDTDGLVDCEDADCTGETCADEGNSCTSDVCNSQFTCTHNPLPDGAACEDDGNPCSVDRCSAGQCVHELLPDGTPCDDGNACTANQCLSGACEAAEIVCDDDDACNGLETCNPGTGCVDGSPLNCDDNNPCTQDCNPQTGCGNEFRPLPATLCETATKSTLTILDKGPQHRKLKWLWKGASIGVPPPGYALCIYAGNPTTNVMGAVVPADPMKWHSSASGNLTYYDPSKSADGIQRMRLRDNGAGTASNLVKGSGVTLHDANLQGLAPVTVQLVSEIDQQCWQSVFGVSDITRNQSDRLKAKYSH